MTGDELRERIENVYIVLEGRQSHDNAGYGALAWFARLVHDSEGRPMNRARLERYLTGAVVVPPDVDTIVRLLEYHVKLLVAGRARKLELQRVHAA